MMFLVGLGVEQRLSSAWHKVKVSFIMRCIRLPYG
jgi:hypothetical protein